MSAEIEIREGLGGRAAFIAGTRIRVMDIAGIHKARQLDGAAELNSAAESILEALPSLTIEQVRAALEYWRTHEEEIQREIDEEERVLKTIPTRK